MTRPVECMICTIVDKTEVKPEVTFEVGVITGWAVANLVSKLDMTPEAKAGMCLKHDATVAGITAIFETSIRHAETPSGSVGT